MAKLECSFDRFAKDTNISYEDPSAWDSFLSVAEKYYAWSSGKSFTHSKFFPVMNFWGYIKTAPFLKCKIKKGAGIFSENKRFESCQCLKSAIGDLLFQS